MVEERSVRETLDTAVKTIRLVGELIKDADAIPSGHLYAALMSHMSLNTYEGVIKILVDTGLVRRGPMHMLIWCGEPAKEKS